MSQFTVAVTVMSSLAVYQWQWRWYDIVSPKRVTVHCRCDSHVVTGSVHWQWLWYDIVSPKRVTVHCRCDSHVVTGSVHWQWHWYDIVSPKRVTVHCRCDSHVVTVSVSVTVTLIWHYVTQTCHSLRSLCQSCHHWQSISDSADMSLFSDGVSMYTLVCTIILSLLLTLCVHYKQRVLLLEPVATCWYAAALPLLLITPLKLSCSYTIMDVCLVW